MVLMKKQTINDLKSSDVKESVDTVPTTQEWRIPFLKEMKDIKAGHLIVDGFSTEEISYLNDFICISW